MSKPRKGAADAAEEQPQTGGSFIRDPDTGKLTQVAGPGLDLPADDDSAPASPHEQPAPAEPAGSGHDSTEEA